MEVAVGEYNVDVNKIIKVALKKYYEDTGKSINCDMDTNDQPVYRTTTCKLISFFFYSLLRFFYLINNYRKIKTRQSCLYAYFYNFLV